MNNMWTLILRIFLLPFDLYFNFRHLPFRQAVKLPIIFSSIPLILDDSGKILINGDVYFGMIKFGKEHSPIVNHFYFRYLNRGTIIFNGPATFAYNCYVSCDKNAKLQFGKNCGFNFGCRIICMKKITFGDYLRCSWDCTFIDSDFHPIIEMDTNTRIAQEVPIKIGRGVWVGHNCIISKGARIADEIIVSSGSVVKGVFLKKNSIIGGNLAKLIAEGYQRDDMIENRDNQ